jgi:hypothetical protein
VTVDELITRLTNLNIDHQEVKVELRLSSGQTAPVTDFHITHAGSRLVLISEETHG